MSANTTLESLSMRRVFNADIHQVFDAWSQAELLAKWFGPEGFEVSNSQVDLKVGGKYSIDIDSPDQKTIKHFGEYVLIERPNKLIFTWELDNQDCSGSENQSANTLVTIELKSMGDKTELLLTHEQLPNREAFEGHQFGWNSSFNSLDHLLETLN